MNSRQERALKNHCRLGAECINAEFTYLVSGCSIVLTVNSGYE
jgi:hypothetical protein